MKNFDLILKVNLIFLVFIVNIFSSIAANWELFPPDTKFWCRNQDGRIFSFMADSVISENYYMLNTKNLDKISLHCFDSIYRNCYEFISNITKPSKIKVLETAQTVTFGFDIKVNINPYLEAGSSDTQKVKILNIDYDFTISCISASVEDIYGSQDSVKEFSIKVKKNTNKPSKFKISKNYGILSFGNLRSSSQYGLLFEEFSVVGYQANDFQYGWQPEDITTKLLNWNVGDIRTVLFYQDLPYKISTELYLDSVINISKNEDVTSIHFKRFIKDSNNKIIEIEEITESYNLKDFNNYFNQFGDIAVSENFGIELQFYNSIYMTSRIVLTNQYGLDSVNVLALARNDSFIDSACNISHITDAQKSMYYALGLGLVNTSFYGLNYTYLDLQGYRQGDKTWGRISLTTDVDDNESSFEYIAVSPNPATDFITIQTQPSEGLKPSEGSEVEIYNILGVKVISELIHPMTSSHRMNVESLSNGLYFVKIGDRVEKFVKM